jgi:glycosyltransferase involved in cell wall biosynthesis
VADTAPNEAPIDGVDVFVDLSGITPDLSEIRRLIDDWSRPDNLGAIARRLTGTLPNRIRPEDLSCPVNWSLSSASPLSALNGAVDAAGRDGLPLLQLRGPVEINSEVVGVLRRCLKQDPMYGFAVPRTGCKERCCFVRLSPNGVGATDWLPRKILADLPECELLVEITGPCVLIAPGVLGNFGAFDGRLEGIPAMMLHYMAGARRCGFRTVLSNRAVVGVTGVTCGGPVLRALADVSANDRTLLRELVPDLERSWQDFRAGSWERFERLCTSSVDAPKSDRRPSLLLDVRNVRSTYNGTAQAILGTVEAFNGLQSNWDVALLAHPQGAAFHGLEKAYPEWRVYTDVPDRSFTAAVRLSQPWHIQEMVDLHDVSLFNAYLMLDTINWDIVYSAPGHLEGTWQFLAAHADAFLFDSDFTGRRFVERFPAARSVPSLVTHFSFDPGEYTRPNASSREKEEFILIVGNDLDHKDVRHTVETLASAFPFRRFKVLGSASVLDSPFVTGQRSGAVPEEEVHRLYSGAQFVVFPSFYEGFGFPILTALAYGRTVLARRSALLDEVAAKCVPRGRLIEFGRRDELVELIGQLLHGDPVAEHPLGQSVTGRPRRWRDVAQDVLTFLEPLVKAPVRNRWIVREKAVRQLVSYRT